MNIEGMLSKFGKAVTVQKATVTSGGYSGDTTTWSTHLSIKGYFSNLSGKQVNKCDKLGIQATLVMYCQYADIQEIHRILYNSIYYDITLVEQPAMSSNFLQVYLKKSDNYDSGSA